MKLNKSQVGTIGALRRYELYGNPGTCEGRRKGALTTFKLFASDPVRAKAVGFKIRKDIRQPKKSALLAEFIGIVLGDGNVNKYQVKISVNSRTDRSYAFYIRRIVKELFGLSASINEEKKNTLGVVISSRNLISFLLKRGICLGDKVAIQVNVPPWIMMQKELMRGCLRGLIDTDGCIYFHIHTTKGIKYRHIGLGFTSYSMPLLISVHKMFLELGIEAKKDERGHVAVYRRDLIVKYMREVGSNNAKHVRRFNSYRNSKIFK